MKSYRPESDLPGRTTLIAFLLILGIALIISFRMVRPYLLCIVMGGILALLFHPLFEWLRQFQIKTKLASAIVTLTIILIIIAPLALFFSLGVKQAIAVGENLARNGSFSFQLLFDFLGRWRIMKAIIGNPEVLEKAIRSWIQSAGKGLTTEIFIVLTNIPQILLQLVLAMITCFFLLIDGNKFLHWMTDKIPLDSDVRARVIKSFKNTSVSVIWATLAAALAQASVILVSFLILGVPAVFLGAGATFIFAWIPILGSTPVWVAASIYLYTQGAIVKTIFMIAFGFFTAVIDNFIKPLVLRGRGQMHPLVSLISIFSGLKMFGIIGIFIGPILAAVVIALLEVWPAVGYRFGILGVDKASKQV